MTRSSRSLIPPGWKKALVPPVHIEALIADGKSYTIQANPRLPALTRDIELEYTAISLVIPQRVRFRYKLDERDADWQDAGTRRQAFYNRSATRVCIIFA